MKKSTGLKLLLTLLTMLPLSAFAHHPNGYKLPDSFFEGFLSGVGHPVIGIDHLLFIVCMGVLGFVIKQRTLVPAIFISGALIGTVVHLNAITIPWSETLVLFSLLLVGLALTIKSQKVVLPVWLTAFIAAGVFHGYAYGESIVGAEVTPLMAYLLGFSLIQLAIAFTAGFICQQSSRFVSDKLISVAIRVCGVGAALTAAVFMVQG